MGSFPPVPFTVFTSHNRLGRTEKGEIAFMETMPHALPKHFLDAKLGSKWHVYCASTQ